MNEPTSAFENDELILKNELTPELVKNWLEENQRSASHLAQLSNVSQPTISRFLSGKQTNLTRESYNKLKAIIFKEGGHDIVTENKTIDILYRMIDMLDDKMKQDAERNQRIEKLIDSCMLKNIELQEKIVNSLNPISPTQKKKTNKLS